MSDRFMMPEQGWIIFGVLAWITGFFHTRLGPKVKMLEVPFLLYFIFGLPSGINSKEVSFEGFRFQFLGLLLILIPTIKIFIKISDVYLLLGSLAVSTFLAFLFTKISNKI